VHVLCRKIVGLLQLSQVNGMLIKLIHSVSLANLSRLTSSFSCQFIITTSLKYGVVLRLVLIMSIKRNITLDFRLHHQVNQLQRE